MKSQFELKGRGDDKTDFIRPSFSDGNGRTCRLVMDYILQSSGLPPALLGDNVDVAILGTQDQDTSRISKTPTDAVMTVLQGVQKAYTLIGGADATSR